jgi:hypothetical protein
MRGEDDDLRVSIVILFAPQWKNHFFTSPMCHAVFGMAGSEIRCTVRHVIFKTKLLFSARSLV